MKEKPAEDTAVDLSGKAIKLTDAEKKALEAIKTEITLSPTPLSKDKITPVSASPKSVSPPMSETILEEASKINEDGVRNLSFLPDEVFSMEVKDLDVKDVLRAISYRYGVNFLINDSVTSKVSLSFKNVKLKDAFLALMKDAQIDFAIDGNIVRINTYENLNALKKEAPLVTRAIHVKYTFDTSPGALLQVGGGASGPGSSTGGGGSGGGSSASGGSSMSGNNLSLLALAVSSMLSKRDGARVAVISRTNTILVTDVEDNVARIEKLIRKLDVKSSQIRILARIIEATKDFTKKIGVQWGVAGNREILGSSGDNALYAPMRMGDKKSRFAIGGKRTHETSEDIYDTQEGHIVKYGTKASPYLVDFPGSFDSAGVGSINLILGKISDRVLDFQLNAMEQDGLGKVLATPKVITQNNQVATINSGFEVPYQTTNAFGTITVNFKKAVIELKVVPHVIADNIFLDLGIRKNDVDFSEAVKVGNNPSLKTKEVDTRVVVHNGDTVVIGGIITQEKVNVVAGIPYLMKIPYLGWLFRYNETKVKNSELLIFITPSIISEKKLIIKPDKKTS
ncbi:MAG: type IV pilus secretin PilQ [bacterium]